MMPEASSPPRLQLNCSSRSTSQLQRMGRGSGSNLPALATQQDAEESGQRRMSMPDIVAVDEHEVFAGGHASASERTEEPGWGFSRKLVLFAMLLLLVICGTAETVSYAANGGVYMIPYRCFINQMVVFVCYIFFTVIHWVDSRRTWRDVRSFSYVSDTSNPLPSYSNPLAPRHSGDWDDLSLNLGDDLQQQQHRESLLPDRGLDEEYYQNSSVARHSCCGRSRTAFLLVGVVAFLDTLALDINLLASHDVSGSLRVILQQLSIPLSMCFSYLILRRLFSLMHVFGALSVLLGIVLCLINVLGGDQESSPAWATVLALSCFPLALSGCLKEWVLIHVEYGFDSHRLNAYVALFQFFIGLALLPLGMYIQNLDTEDIYFVSQRDIARNFYAGFKCGILGVTPFDGNHEPLYGITNCHSAAISTWVYLATVCFFNLLMMWVIKEGTAVLFFVANAVIIPSVSLLSASPLYEKIGLHQDTYTIWQFIGLFMTVGGCFYFGVATIDRSEREMRVAT